MTSVLWDLVDPIVGAQKEPISLLVEAALPSREDTPHKNQLVFFSLWLNQELQFLNPLKHFEHTVGLFHMGF
jgi:hypothetical protein